jgi:hypothetical protein
MQTAAPSRLRNTLAALAAGLLLAACSASGSTAPDCETAADCARGQTCASGSCVEGSVDTGSEDTATDTGRVDTGSEDAGADTDPTDTATADTDPADTAVDDTAASDTAVDDTAVEDTAADTTAVEDTTADTTADTDPGDTTVDDTTPPAPTWELRLFSPIDGDAFRAGDPNLLLGELVSDTLDFATVEVSVVSSIDGLVGIVTPDATGRFELSLAGLTGGRHTLTVRAVDATSTEQTATVAIAVCPTIPALDFNADLTSADWLIVGDASREPAGWLELTGLAGGQQGAIFYLGSTLSRGDTEISLRVSTGQCPLPGPCDSPADGADGFAMSIIGLTGVAELANLLAAARPGEGLGYAVTPTVVDAFHIEFDTYHNAIDPTLGNHVAITLNGDPTNHLLWTETPTLENNAWHDIVLRIAGVRVTVIMDGVTVIDADAPGLDFKGGYIGFTGSTGGSTNYHRIDDLQIVQACTF